LKLATSLLRAHTSSAAAAQQRDRFPSRLLAVALGFALIWHIWWLAIAGLLGSLVVGLLQAWRTDTETVISAEEVAAFHGTPAAEEIAA